jgi:hypothetical protein
MKTGKPVPNNFKIITNQLNLSSQKDVHDLAICIKASGFSGGVVAIDTLNAASPNMDENSSKDMGNLIDRLKLLQRQTNSLAMTTHHTGKDEGQGMRGHSSLHAAIDAAIYLKGTGPTKTWILQKIRDGEPGESHNFKLIAHDLGLDDEGSNIISCSIKSDSSVAAARPIPAGKNMILVFNQVTNFIESEHTRSGQPVSVPYEVAVEHGARALIHVNDHRRTNQAKKILRKLVEQDFFESQIINGKELIGFR